MCVCVCHVPVMSSVYRPVMEEVKGRVEEARGQCECVQLGAGL